MPRFAVLVAILAALGVIGIGPSTALAGCPSAQSVMTSNDSHAKNGYMCAQDNVSGSMSIGAGKTHSYNINTNSQYFPLYYCDQTTSSSVTVAHGQTWGSASFTATNWLTPSNTRHWSVGILWTAGGYSVTGFSGGCSVNSQVFNNPPAILNISSVSAANIPTGGAQAGQSFSLPVTVSPSSATGIVAVEDNGVPVASATLSGGAATLKWIPAMQGTSKVTVVYKGDSANTPASTSTYTVPVSGGIGVQITSMPLSTTASNTAIANISVSPSTTTGIVALVNTAAGKAIGNAVLSNGSASIPFTFTPGSSYTFIAQYLPSGSSPPTGQSYPYAWNSLSPKRGPALDSVTLNQGLDEMLAGIPQQPTQSTQTVSNLVTASAARPTVSARCPSGTRLINFDALSFGPADAFTVTSQDQSGATAKTAAANYGSKILAQAICRPAGAKPSLVDNLGYGTIRPDVMITAKRGATLYGGPGRDRLEALGFRSAVFGGVGADTIVLGLRGSVADGGTGDDTIVAMGRSALLLVGGLGNDTLIGPYGSALINAYDGKGGDTVVCRSAMTRVMADAGDSISGPCKTVPVATANDPGATAPGDQIASRVATSQTTG